MVITMIPYMMTTTVDSVFTEPQYIEIITVEMSIFGNVGYLWTYIITSPYYLYKNIYTRYTTYKESGIREFYAWKNYRVIYDKEIETLAKYESFVENSSILLDKETDRDTFYYQFMKLYIEKNVALLKTKQQELIQINTKYFASRKEALLADYQNRITAYEECTLPEIVAILQGKQESIAFYVDAKDNLMFENMQQYKAKLIAEFEYQRSQFLDQIKVLNQQVNNQQTEIIDLKRVNQTMIDNADRDKSRIQELEADNAQTKKTLDGTEENYRRVIREQDPLIQDIKKCKDMLASLGIEIQAKENTIQLLSKEKNTLIVENKQLNMDLEELEFSTESKLAEVKGQLKKTKHELKQKTEESLMREDVLTTLQTEHTRTNKTLMDLRSKYNKLEEIIKSSPELQTTGRIINSHVALRKVFQDLKDKQVKLETLNAQMFLKWDHIKKQREEYDKNKADNKETLDSIKRYNDEFERYQMLQSLPGLSNKEKENSRIDAQNAKRNMEDRKENLVYYFRRQEELKSGIQYDYKDINTCLKELNILSNDIHKYNKDFEGEIMKVFPEFLNLNPVDNMEYPLATVSSPNAVQRLRSSSIIETVSPPFHKGVNPKLLRNIASRIKSDDFINTPGLIPPNNSPVNSPPNSRGSPTNVTGLDID